MSRIAILTGLLLIALGAGGYFATGQREWTALIPAAMGLLLALLGLLALKESLRKNAMHVAVVLGLLGFVATAHALYTLGAKILEEPGLLAQSTMAVICGAFVALSVKSFLDARRARSDPRAARPVEEQGTGKRVEEQGTVEPGGQPECSARR